MRDEELSRDEALAELARLRQELERLREELRRVRRETHEVPPHHV